MAFGIDLASRVWPTVTKYGVSFSRLQASDMDLVRNFRNDAEIRQAMIYREHITEEMQREWFAAIDNEFNHYSLVIYRGIAIGMAHTKNIVKETLTGEGGMIIWDRDHQTSLVPFMAAVAGTDWIFFEVGLRRLTSRVLASNRRAVRYNRALGYVFDQVERGGEILIGYLTPETYSARVDPLRPILESAAQHAVSAAHTM